VRSVNQVGVNQIGVNQVGANQVGVYSVNQVCLLGWFGVAV